MEDISMKKSTLTIGAILIATTLVLLFVIFNSNQGIVVQEIESKSLEARFAKLSTANSNSCGGTFNYVDSMPDNTRIQGSCCSAMDFHRYSEQIEGLAKYSKYDKIPQDPYDVPTLLAKELLDYQKNIILDVREQDIYDKAMDMSMEGGPCCCKCWHWYAYEGLAKYLITEHSFSAEQIAEVWDLSDACGGSGHIEGMGHGH